MKKRSIHSLSHFNLLTTQMGLITPIECVDVLPGDSFMQDNSVFLRTMPLVAPVMHPVHVEIRSFFVPLRIIWDEFEDFITGGPKGLNNSVHPHFVADEQNCKLGELNDYLGIPPDTLLGTKVNCLYARAYALIYNEYFRDQDIDEELPISFESGQDTTTPSVLQRADWRKDYFTLARPFEQKGPAAVVPITSSGGAITGLTGTTTTTVTIGSDSGRWNPATGLKSGAGVNNSRSLIFGDGDGFTQSNHTHAATAVSNTVVSGNASFDLGTMSISDFREAMQLQRFEEIRSLYGSRYEDYQAVLGVRSSDGRLQNPEYLGGGQRTIQFSEVLQTSEGSSPVGTLRGHGIGALKTKRFLRFFNEHGILLTLLVVRPISIYTQGLNRMFLRETRFDYWQPQFEHIGQQSVLNKELYAASPNGDDTFGFSNRYNEYRYHPSNVHGEFRTYYEDWHLGRKFESTPTLNSDFLKCHPTTRIFAETSGNYDQLLVMCQNHIRARRLISKNGDPI
nr:unnamed protein product [uncultured bacterium]